MRPNQTPDAHRINGRISAREVFVIGPAGEQLGVMSVRQGIEAAESAELDLVEVAPNASPPVCRIMDYGKFKYKEQKKEAESKKKRSEVQLKELRLRYRTEKGDLDTKLGQAREFIAEGNKVKFSMRFKGREIMYVDLGVKKFDAIIAALSEIAIVDERSPSVGRQIHIILAPIPQKSAPKSSPATGAKNTAPTRPGGSKQGGERSESMPQKSSSVQQGGGE
jgi:translation initiation factor IF-3